MKLLIIALAGLSIAQIAGAATFNIDKDHSTISFGIRHMISKVHGVFKDVSGDIVYDEKDPKADSVNVDIKTTSVDTHVTKRDDDLRSDKFFDSTKFPDMTFKSTKVKLSGKKMKVEGILSLHGVDKPVTLTAEYTGTAKDPWGNMRAGFSASTKINRKDFGLKWNKTLEAGGLMVGDDVDINLDIEAVQAKDGTKTDAK